MASPSQASIDDAMSRYGPYAIYLSDPEWGPILLDAAAQGKSAEWLQGQLAQTQKWKSMSDAARQFDLTQRTDPATAARTIEQKKFDLRQMARASGVTLGDASFQDLATKSATLGWSRAEEQAAVAAQYRYDPSAGQGGTAATTKAQLMQISRDYAIPGDVNAGIAPFMESIQRGEGSVDGFREFARWAAKNALAPNGGALAQAIDAGMTVTQFGQTYAASAARLLGISPDAVNFSDTKWNQALRYVDPKSGQVAPMNLNQWEQTLRTDPQYNYAQSTDAKNQAAAMLDAIGKDFGKVA